LNKQGIEILTKGYDGNSKKIFKENLERASKVLVPLVERHADRMNYKKKEDIKTFDSKNVFVVNLD
jgi:RNA binding exosome subunit